MQNIDHFLNLISKANHIVITTHLYPDADGIGSQIALCMALRRRGKSAICVNDVALLDRYRYLDPERSIISYKAYQSSKEYSRKEIDLFIVVDTNSLPRVGNKMENLVNRSRNLLFIDHHPCPKQLAALHCIDTTVAATGELVGNLINALKVKIDLPIARALYTAILIDTSSFRYPTVTGNTHRLLGQLLDAGVQPPTAYNKIYGTKKVGYMQLLGKVLSSAKTTKDGSICWLILKEENLEKYHVDTEDTHGFVNHLLIMDNVKIAVMFRQAGKMIKVSLRSAGDIDVGIMAQALGGGGHNHSAATVIEGELETVTKEIISKLQIMLENL